MRLAPLCALLVTCSVTDWNSPLIDGAPTFNLAGDHWQLQGWHGPGSTNCSYIKGVVPGDSYTDLWKEQVIQDPMEPYGDHNTAWAGRTSWSYSTNFSKEQLDTAFGSGAHILLVAEGLETNASVLINGVEVLVTDDMWVRYTTPVTSIIQPKKRNTIEVRFHSVYDECQFSNPEQSNRTCPHRVFIRQSASSWGWDWVNRYSPQGIWRPIYFAGIKPQSAAITSFSATVKQNDPRVEAKNTTWDVSAKLTLRTPSASENSTIVKGIVHVCGEWAGATPVAMDVELTNTITEVSNLICTTHVFQHGTDVLILCEGDGAIESEAGRSSAVVASWNGKPGTLQPYCII
jgi:beta-galactosidase/beta-glucuronidase